MEPRRSERLAESLRGELDEIINYELDDRRITTVSVTEVLVSPDHRKAHIRLAVTGSPDEQQNCLQAIEKAKGYIKHLLAERVDIYRLPDLYFDSDLAPGIREKAPALLRRIRKGRPRPEMEKNPSE
jgi:ribosome-binding factor A